MSIRTKLLTAIACPLLALLIASASIVWGSWGESSEMNTIQDLAGFATRISALVHETQKERGATAGFLGNQSDEFAHRLDEQRKLTDARVEELNDYLTGFSPSRHGEDFSQEVEAGLTMLSQLDAKRRAISALGLPTDEAIGYYTQMNGRLLNAVGKTALATTDGAIAVRTGAYASFLKSKERAGIERAVLANTFAKDQFGPGMYEKFTDLVALQNVLLNEFLNLAPAQDRAFYEDKLSAPAVAQVEDFRRSAAEHAQTGGFGRDAGEWFDTITAKINLLKEVDDYLAAELLSEAGAKARAASTRLVTVLTASLLVAAAVAVAGTLSVRSVLRRIAGLTERVKDIAEGEGDLTQRLEVNNDELGRLSGWFNALIEKIESVIVSMAGTSHQLAAASEQLLSTANGLMEGAGESKHQSTSISAAAEEMSLTMNQTASATEEMSVGIANVTESIDAIRKSIEQIAERSSQSADVARSATERVEGGNAQIGQLGSAASEIGNVMDVIQDIAEQTNLLALNATIEAARAGEAGKGFAVVATEVKELAKQTAEATDGIRARVLSMQQSTQETVTTMADIDQVIRQINEVSEAIAKEVGQQSESVATIAANMQQSSAASQTIATGVSESAVASKEITRSVSAVDNQLSSTLDGAQCTQSAGASVAELAADLQKQVSQFKTR
ncbi:Methyl-accepting chemotaxis protein PctB [Posidoniimonas corsicana]|uniref:Methyl-accepting chemotaxis protein PctB n=1 Tax=Posidoniimonas corsicana TaxID=1938618 RepID=A0A5C5UXG7_9BACT|nr:methyl-accepting chemotaxis protein [Posidoniimonas corsicana]TWT31046.1 Methyl-accepting chemotaxis protein PctB [Posidoniimonas corsicana]